ncbi:MAG: AgmX/PglI C-terminal domain-containing protein [Candidatus Eiseniibacteriota bacterium]
MSTMMLAVEFDRIRARTRQALIASAVVHAALLLYLGFARMDVAEPDELIEVTWLEPEAPKPPPVRPEAEAAAKPAPTPPAARKAPTPEVAKAAAPEPKPKPVVDAGAAGRQRAKEATKQLNAAAASLDGMLTGLDATLASKEPTTPARTTQRRTTRSGRGSNQVADITPMSAAAGASAGPSVAIAGARIEIEALPESGSGAPQGRGADGAPTSASEIRTDASLLAVVRKYAPGIQFCYDNELERNPSLGGKLIVAITVAASGKVTEAAVVKDTLRSAALTACALAQIEAWKFPKVASGEVTFQAPFVFTPPE